MSDQAGGDGVDVPHEEDEAGREHTGSRGGSGRPEGHSTARDITGVDPQESITKDDPSNAEFHDRVDEG